jgi:hypothetical protein
MPEPTAITLSVEDVSQKTWDELTLLMLNKSRTDMTYDPDILEGPNPECATYCSSFCICANCGCVDS